MPRFARIVMIVTVLSLAHLSASAAVFTVNKVADTNDGVCDADCSLREAIAAANASAENDEVVFNTAVFHSPQTIVLTTGEMVITNNGAIAIYGPGSSKLTIDGNQTSRILTILGLANVKISGLTFTRGNGVSATNTGRAGAIYNLGGTTVIYNSVITGNTAANGGGLNNAADASTTPDTPGNLRLVNCIVSNNVASGSGGGMQNFSTSTVTIVNSLFTGNVSNGTTGGGGGAFNGAAIIVNSTFSGNSAPAGSGGGIQSNGTIGQVFTNVTIANNTSLSNGGGLHRGTTDPDFFIRNSIIAGNTGTAASPDVTNSAAGLVSLGNNIIGNVGTSTGWVASDLQNVNPILGPLGSHGGTVRTHPLLSGSPALDAGQACVLDLSCASNNPPVAVTNDNRYYPRGTDAGVDIGAYEKSTSSFAILPNAGLNQPYSHTITANTTGFVYIVLPGGSLPPGLNLTTNGNEVLISGTPTVAGTYSFPLGLAKLPTLTETETVLYTITVSADPNNVVLSARFTYNGGAFPEKVYAKLTNVDGRVTNVIIPPLGHVYLDKITPDSAWLLSFRSKSLGEATASIAGFGSVVISEVDIVPPAMSLVPIGTGKSKR